jgi:hypothetical protein
VNDIRIIRIAFVGGPCDGDVDELKINGVMPLHVKRARPVPVSFANFVEDEDVLPSMGIHEYELRGGPGLVGRTGDGAWIYDYKGEQ